MSTIYDITPKEVWDAAFADRLINRQVHPTLPLEIYDYSQVCQFSRAWNVATLAARGLIVDASTKEIVGRPLGKFFNHGEPGTPADLMVGAIVASDKADGCFTAATKLNLWEGGTISIGKVVQEKLTPTLVGMNEDGNLVPSKVINWFNHGLKSEWLNIFLDTTVSERSGSGNIPNRMQVTPNHHLFVNGVYKLASEVVAGDSMVSSERSLPPKILHFIRSSMLGDGCVTKSGKNAKYQESHSTAQHSYVDYMKEILGNSGLEPRNTISGYGSDMKWVTTKEYAALNTIRDEWYSSTKKVVPQDLSWFDDFTVAKWYMDDGSLVHTDLQKDRASFATNGFEKESVERLADKLFAMYGVKAKVAHSKGWYLRVNAGKSNEIDTFWKAITPHVIFSLRYKVPEKYRDIPFIHYGTYSEVKIVRETKVLSVEPTVLPVGYKNVTAYDIGTETTNYMANGVIVHNSMGVSYPTLDGSLNISTRGSFASDQAKHATALYLERYHGSWEPDSGYTYVWEIIYPTNRIVVNYGDMDDLILIARVNIATGVSEPASAATEWIWNKVTEFPYTTLTEALAASPRENAEGLVVHFLESDTRVKIKQSDYITLHRVITGASSRRIHEMLVSGSDFNSWLIGLPDEFIEFVETTRDRLLAEFAAVDADIDSVYASVVVSLPEGYTQKEFAQIINRDHGNLRGYLFSKQKGEAGRAAIVKAIWKQIEPEFEKPFWNLNGKTDIS